PWSPWPLPRVARLAFLRPGHPIVGLAPASEGANDRQRPRRHPHHPHRQPPASRRLDPDDGGQGRRNPGGRGGGAGRGAGGVPGGGGRQIDAGVDIVNDGEMSKPSYATYVKDRLDGFGGGGGGRSYFAHLAGSPRGAEPVAATPGGRKRPAPACTSEIAVRDREAIVVDMATLGEAVAGTGVAGTFTSAASPGGVSLFFENQFYDSDEEYLFAIAEAMRFEYEAIAAGGATVQL